MLPSSDNLAQILVERSRQQARSEALILYGRTSRSAISWRRLLAGSARFASHFKRAGVEQGDVVVELLPPGEDLVFGFLGALLLGAVPSILPFQTEKLDPQRYLEGMTRLVDVTKPAAILGEPALVLELERHLPGNPAIKAFLTPDGASPGESAPAIPHDDWAGLQRLPDDLVLLQHSSGTTGLQKGVALSHGAVLNQLRAYLPVLKARPDDVVVSWLPLYHDMGLIAGFLLPLLAGLKLVLLSPFEWVRGPWLLLQAVHDHRGSLSWLPNFAYNFCASKIPEGRLRGLDLTSWRAVINCSEPIYAESHRMLARRLAANGLSPEALSTCYAMAENVFAVSQGEVGKSVVYDRVDRRLLASEKRALPADGPASVEMVSAGAALPNCRLRVVDGHGAAVADRTIGELALQSDCMLTGYYNRPDATHQAIRQGWLMTGDLGYLADGQVYITGRKKDLIIVGGRNIYPQDVEYVINRVNGVYPGRVVVFGVLNAELGTEDVVAVVEADEAAPSDHKRLAVEIRLAVARGSEVSLGDVRVVDRHWLVKTSSGKIARAANREKYLGELG